MIDAVFIATLAVLMAALLLWGYRALPQERWQMIAAVPVAKDRDGEWRGMNLTFYGLFSATGSVFGTGMAILLLASLRVSMTVATILVAGIVVFCLPASRLVAAIVEKKSSTYTIAGAAFVAAILLPPVFWLGGRYLPPSFGIAAPVLPAMGAAAIAYALAEAIGRLACMSFGCCYGMPLRNASPALARLFHRFNTVFHGETKKAAYASGLQEEPLVPVQALTSIVFTLSGLIGLSFFFAQSWRLALLVPVLGTWGWRGIAENLRADHRGHTKISAYQVMSLIAMGYLSLVALLMPAIGPVPDLRLGLSQLATLPVILFLQGLWVFLFLFYGRSQVTASIVSFHVVSERI